MADNQTRKPSSNGHAPHPSMPSFDHERVKGHTTSNFDFDRSRLSMSPTMLWTLLAGAVTTALVIGSLVWDANSRIAKVEVGITDLRDEIRTDRDATQTKQQAVVDCLLQERANRGWTCPLAPSARAPDQPRREKRKVASEPKGPTNPWTWLGTALAGDKK